MRTVDAWAESDPLAALVDLSGGPTSGSRGSARLDELAVFSTRWDARAGLERDQAERRALDPRLERLAVDAAMALGQAGRDRPRESRYDAIVMTGGMVRAEIVKPRFVRELLDAGLTTREVIFLGGFRRFSSDERRLAALLAIESSDEFDAMVEGLDRAFGPLGSPVVVGEGDRDRRGWRVSSWSADDRRLSVVAAPSSDPDVRRAHTADTYRFWAGRCDDSIRRVLVVTTPVYVPYQAAAAVEVLGLEHGLAVETIGVSTTASDLGSLTQPFTAQNHLQELRSAIFGMRSLRAALSRP